MKFLTFLLCCLHYAKIIKVEFLRIFLIFLHIPVYRWFERRTTQHRIDRNLREKFFLKKNSFFGFRINPQYLLSKLLSSGGNRTATCVSSTRFCKGKHRSIFSTLKRLSSDRGPILFWHRRGNQHCVLFFLKII